MDEKASKTPAAEASRSVETEAGAKEPANSDDTAAYVGDLLVALRNMTTDREHAFLSYLIGVAAEEAIRLAEGHPSSAPRKPKAGKQTAKAKRRKLA